MEYVDVVYCHRPDATTPIEETVRAMNWVIDQGWAFYWGTSEWSAQQITEAWGVANRLDLVGPIVEQPEYNLFSRHKVLCLNFIVLVLLACADPNSISNYAVLD
jgi:aryl-alcohol dehydrogenase-like predicted oxidoreductase